VINFWSFAGMGPFLIAVPDTDDATKTGPFIWTNQGMGNAFTQPANAPGGRVGAIVGQFLMVGDVLQSQTQVIGTGNGTQSTFNFGLNDIPMLSTGNVYDQAGLLAGTFNNGLITGSGLLAPPSLPGTLASIGDTLIAGNYASSVFSVTTSTDPGQLAFASITANAVTLLTSAATYNYASGVATWVWMNGPFGFGSGVTYPISLTPYSTSIVGGTNTVSTNGYAPYSLLEIVDSYAAGSYADSALTLSASSDPGKAAFTSMTVNGKTFTSASASYSYSGGSAQWVWLTGPFGFTNGSIYPLNFVGAAFGSSIVAGQVSSGSLHPITTIGFSTFSNIGSNSALSTFNGYSLATGTGSVETAGLSQVNYESGDLTLVLSGAPPIGDQIFANYTQAAPSRVQWSAIGDPTRWPIPLTADAVAFQSGFEDLEVDLGPVMFIAGYPLYAIIFQRTGIIRTNYVGGNVVFSFGVFSKNRGLIAKGAAIQVGTLVYFLSQDGFFVTDGNQVSPIGTDPENDLGIDGWFWDNVNVAALATIRCGYDTSTRCVSFSIPTGTNALPDTLLSYNPLANRWTKSAIPSAILWTDNNGSATFGTNLRLGLFTQANQYSVLQGPTLNGYLESLDLMDTDAQLRFTMGVRPNIVCTDTPQAMVGTRNSMQDAINYTVSMPPDSFSRIVPALTEGLYTRVRISSSAAQNIIGATLDQQIGGAV
jgi:hypothetical protein